MTTSTLTRTTSAIFSGLALAAVTAMAVPTSFTLSLAGLADRDVVRNPYSSLSGASGFVLTSQNIGVVGPNLGLGVGFSPGLLLGGGGGGGFTSGGSGGSTPFVGSFSPPAQSNVGLNLPVVTPSIMPSVSAPTTQTRITLQTLPVNGVVSVPDGGASVILLGGGLLAVFMLRRRFAKL